MNQVFEIFADGQKVGITVAPGLQTAGRAATTALTRRTHSKSEGFPDYLAITVTPMVIAHEVVEAIPKKPIGPHRRRRGDQLQELAYKSVPATSNS